MRLLSSLIGRKTSSGSWWHPSSSPPRPNPSHGGTLVTDTYSTVLASIVIVSIILDSTVLDSTVLASTNAEILGYIVRDLIPTLLYRPSLIWDLIIAIAKPKKSGDLFFYPFFYTISSNDIVTLDLKSISMLVTLDYLMAWGIRRRVWRQNWRNSSPPCPGWSSTSANQWANDQ